MICHVYTGVQNRVENIFVISIAFCCTALWCWNFPRHTAHIFRFCHIVWATATTLYPDICPVIDHNHRFGVFLFQLLRDRHQPKATTLRVTRHARSILNVLPVQSRVSPPNRSDGSLLFCNFLSGSVWEFIMTASVLEHSHGNVVGCCFLSPVIWRISLSS